MSRIVAVVLLLLALLIAWMYLAINVLPPYLVAAGQATPDAYLKAITDTRSTLVQAGAGFGVFVGALVAFLSLRQNQRAHREVLSVTQRGQTTERFSRAVEQLAGQGVENVVLQLGAIYALEQIARDSNELYGPVVELLTGFFRTRSKGYDVKTEPNWHIWTGDREPPARDYHRLDHLQSAVLTVMSRIGRTLDPEDHDFDLNGVDLRGAVLGGAPLWNAMLNRADLRWANLSYGDISQANMSNARLEGANLFWVDAERVLLMNADLQRAVLRLGRFSDACLLKANLTEASLVAADLRGADLRGTNLGRADFRHARLKDASLEGATVDGAEFAGTDLSGVYGITKTQFAAMVKDEQTKPPLTFSPGLRLMNGEEVFSISVFVLRQIPTAEAETRKRQPRIAQLRSSFLSLRVVSWLRGIDVNHPWKTEAR